MIKLYKIKNLSDKKINLLVMKFNLKFIIFDMGLTIQYEKNVF